MVESFQTIHRYLINISHSHFLICAGGKMIDGHIHIERGTYTLDWINQFVSKAVEMEIDEIRLLEHCYRFDEFVPMYDSVCA